MSERPRVFVINEPSVSRTGRRPDLSLMEKYGEVHILVRDGEYPSFAPREALQRITERLRGFNPKRDYLAWAGGEALSAVMVGSLLADMDITDVRWLRYERPASPGRYGTISKRPHYTVVEVPIFGDVGSAH
jgi:hypothetical protein